MRASIESNYEALYILLVLGLLHKICSYMLFNDFTIIMLSINNLLLKDPK